MSGGFFEELGLEMKKRDKSSSSPSSRRKSSSSRQIEETCEDCGLYKTCKSPRMQPTGEGKKEILVCAEAPGALEDEKNKQLIGDSGQYLRDILCELDLELDRDFWKTNALICRPPNNRTPSPKELRICRRNLLNTIEMYRPKVLVLIGEPAFDSYMGPRLVGRIKKIAYSNWVGEVIPDQESGMWICPIYHPSYLMRQGGKNKVLESMYREQLRKIVLAASEELPVFTPSKIETTTDECRAVAWIEELLQKQLPYIVFDYETTGRKPHRRGHRIKSISFCDGEVTRAFLYSDVVGRLWGHVLDSSAEKVCHNIPFEDMWSRTIVGKKISGPRWDTMLAAHSLNNTKNIGLKFQVYTKFGVLGYDAEVNSYLQGVPAEEDPDSANAFNRIDEAPVEKLLYYNGEDSMFTNLLYLRQKREFEAKKKLLNGAKFFFASTEHLTRAQDKGIRIDQEKLDVEQKKIDRRLQCVQQRIMDSAEVKKWDGQQTFNFNSSDQLAHLLYDLLRIKVMSKTGRGKRSVDEEALEEMDLPFVKDVLEYRRWSKAKKTYLGQYRREMVDGFIHPFFNLWSVDTFRSSSSAPNFQNVPKRDEQIKNVIRSVIVPRPGNRLVEYDFKQTEVCTAACYNRDPNLIRYIEDPRSDMHRDMASELFLRSKEEVSKQERYLAKNGFVFASFYGSFFEQTAPDMWKRLPDETRENLRRKGIDTYEKFESLVERADKKFWGEKFPVYAKWKKDTVTEYERKGYIDMFTDFRCLGPMKRNEVINYRIQGSAFHILLWTFDHVSEETKDLKRSCLVGQIHDSIVADVHPDDELIFDRLVFEYGTRKVREAWPWIVIPLTVEKERSAVDGNWAAMESCGALKGE